MTEHIRPDMRPANPQFSSGPCTKRPNWSLSVLNNALIGRSHRSKLGKEKLQAVIDNSREILCLPDDYKIAIVPASDTGAVEMALWSLLGARGVEMLVWESFGAGWASDVVKQLDFENATVTKAEYGHLPNLDDVNFDNDVVFTWNGTTSGVKVPDGKWIPSNRKGLTLCDATSAAFAMQLPWEKLDVTTYSWQKVLGGEGQHGMLILSPRAVERLENYTPPWPLPKIFRLTKGGKLIDGIFKGETINTPSMIAVEDALDGLNWAKSVGGLTGLIKRSVNNLSVLENWVFDTPWVDFLCDDKSNRSNTSVCFKIVDPWFQALADKQQSVIAKQIATTLDAENVAYDIASYRDAPAGLRIWAGATVEQRDLELLTPWLDWAYARVKQDAELKDTK